MQRLEGENLGNDENRIVTLDPKASGSGESRRWRCH